MMEGLARHVPALLARARALLDLPGGPSDRLAAGEIDKAARAVAALHGGLVGARQLATASTYDDPVHLGAYLLWWWPQSYAKVQAALALLPGTLDLHNVLDLGAGPAPGALAVLDRFPAAAAVAADASAAALAEAHRLAPGRTLQTLATPLPLSRPAPGGPFDLLLAAHLTSELPADAAGKAELFAELARGHLAERGTLLLLEPALRETGRALLEVRDRLIAAHGLAALAPCLTQRPCPALQQPREWCTSRRGWQAPLHLVQLAHALGLRAHLELSFAYVALSREVAPPPADLFRAVGLPPAEKGKKRVFVCNDGGRVPATRLDREATGENADFERIEHGGLVELRGLVRKGDGLRVGPGSQVRLR